MIVEEVNDHYFKEAETKDGHSNYEFLVNKEGLLITDFSVHETKVTAVTLFIRKHISHFFHYLPIGSHPRQHQMYDTIWSKYRLPEMASQANTKWTHCASGPETESRIASKTIVTVSCLKSTSNRHNGHSPFPAETEEK